MKQPLYIALVVDDNAKKELFKTAQVNANNSFSMLNGKKLKFLCHHLTLAYGKAITPELLQFAEEHQGENFHINVEAYGDNKLASAVACSIEEDVPCSNKTPHITLAVNEEDGGKPVDSNKIEGNWKSIFMPTLNAQLQIVYKGDANAKTPKIESYMKKNVNLTESQLNRMILKTAKKLMKESVDADADYVWDKLIENNIATEEELRLVTDINGYSIDTLNDVIYARTGYHSYGQLVDCGEVYDDEYQSEDEEGEEDEDEEGIPLF